MRLRIKDLYCLPLTSCKEKAKGKLSHKHFIGLYMLT